MAVFWIVWSLVIVQRLAEVALAKRNEQWMREKGAVEYGERHYKWMVLMHTSFFVVMLTEWLVGDHLLHPYWQLLLTGYIVLQGLRIWTLASLGRYWNTKILVIPGGKQVSKGAYASRIRHPNYLIVTLELLILPLIFQAYITVILFTALNAFFLLSIRIPTEEKALAGR